MYLNTYESKTVHSNLNVRYNILKPKIKNIWQIANSKKFYHQKGINPNLYYTSRSRSRNYNKNKSNSIKFFKKIFDNGSEFINAISKKPSKATGTSRNTYKKQYKLKTVKT